MIWCHLKLIFMVFSLSWQSLVWYHWSDYTYYALIKICRAGWGMLPPPKQPLLNKLGWVESCNGDMTTIPVMTELAPTYTVQYSRVVICYNCLMYNKAR